VNSSDTEYYRVKGEGEKKWPQRVTLLHSSRATENLPPEVAVCRGSIRALNPCAYLRANRGDGVKESLAGSAREGTGEVEGHDHKVLVLSVVVHHTLQSVNGSLGATSSTKAEL
jgi:hypothetical protein